MARPVNISNFALDEAVQTGVIINAADPAFGAIGDGSNDDTGAIQAAINLAQSQRGVGNTVIVPPGLYRTTAQLTIVDGVILAGAGTSGANRDTETSLSARPITTLKADAALTGNMLVVTNATRAVHGAGVRDLALDCQGVAAMGLKLDRVRMGEFKNLRIDGATTNCLWAGTSSATANDNTQHNVFSNLQLESRVSGAVPLSLSGNASGSANVCHNTFERIYVDHSGGGTSGPTGTGAVGASILNADNNDFNGLFIFSRGTAATATGSGGSYGLYLGDHARANYFHHVEPGPNGAYVEAAFDASAACNQIRGYDRENGQAAPTLAASATLMWDEWGRNATGAHMPNALRVKQLILTRSSQSQGAGISVDASVANLHEITLTGIGINFSAITGAPASQPGGGYQSELLILTFIQDGSGSRTITTYPANLHFAGAVAPTLTTTAGRRDTFVFIYVGATSTWYEIARAQNVAP